MQHASARPPSLCLIAAAAMLVVAPGRARAQTRVLDDFDAPVLDWKAMPSEGVSLTIGSDAGHEGRAMRLDVDFHGGAGYAIAHKDLARPITLPDNYEIDFWLRGDIPVENLELKLIDSTGNDVWWDDRVDFAYPRRWTRIVTQKRHIRFAWGPRGGGELHRLAAIEIVVTAGRGGRGTVWVDDLTLTPREPVRPYDLTPRASASSSAPGAGAERAIDGDTTTAWRSGGAAGAQWLAIDFGRMREYGGLTIDWAPGAHAADYVVETSSDGARWDTAYVARGSDGGRDDIPLPDAESRWVRLAMPRQAAAGARAYGIREVVVRPLAWAETPNAFFESLAREAPRDRYPRYLHGEQSHWTVVGVDADANEGLLNEDGMLETGQQRFSVEPFLWSDGRLVGWADVGARQSLLDGDLPIPSVDWTAGELGLTVTAFADGTPGASSLVARYRVHNAAHRARRVTLFLALRPFQVNPATQQLNVPGGVATVRSIVWDGRRVLVNGTRAVVPGQAPSAFGAATFDGGGVVPALAEGRVPDAQTVRDPHGRASGALAFVLDIPAGGTREVDLGIPFGVRTPAPDVDSLGVATRLARTAARWREALGRMTVELPPDAAPIARTLRTTLAYILINRDGPRIQPGSRAYARSWIRDGALTSAALLRLGHPAAAREFIEWFAPYQFPSGKVPCCVDARGADPVPENDSHGELIFAIMDYYRYVHDRAFLERMWPHIAAAVAYMDSLRHSRMTPEYRTGDRRAFYGLLPQSISHEGYSAHPEHSYWDDLWALRGFKDAADAATVLGRAADARRIAAIRDEFARDLGASIRLAMAQHHIDYIPGSVELGDFDATSTTIALDPVEARAILPDSALRSTFERFWRGVHARRDSTGWEAYTPYELRAVGALVRLGWRDRALALLDGYLADQRPPGWNEWPEVITRDPREPRFIGDMPHTWVGSDFVRSALDLFAWDREADSALVIGAGVPAAWVTTAPGVVVRHLPTPHGPLDLAMRGDSSVVTVRLGGALVVPRGGLVVRSPLDRPIRSATVNGRAAAHTGTEVVVRRLPTVVELRYR